MGTSHIVRHGARLRVLAALSIAAGMQAIVPQAGMAATLKLPDTSYNYTVIDQDLSAAVQEFGANLGIKVSISPEVKGRIQGRIPEGKAQAFLDRLATSYNLEWYYDGSVLFVTSARENRTQLLVLNPISFDHLKNSLDALQISDPRFPVRPAPGKGVVMVSGPPRYVALIEQTLAGLVAEEQARPKPVAELKTPLGPKVTVLTVFRGGSTTILRDGRPERLGSPDTDSPAQYGPQAAANQPAVTLPVSAAPSPNVPLTAPGTPLPGSVAPVPGAFAPGSATPAVPVRR